MTIEQRALTLVNEAWVAMAGVPLDGDDAKGTIAFDVAMLALERHEAFRQEVSEAVKEYREDWSLYIPRKSEEFDTLLSRFIIEPPVDPLVEALDTFSKTPGSAWGFGAPEDRANTLRAALAKHGLQITGVET